MIFARRETVFLVLGDILLLCISLWLALVLRSFEVPSPAYYLEHLQVFVLIFAISLLVFFISGLYEKQTRLVRSLLVSRVVGAQIANAFIAILLFFILPFSIAPKTILLVYLVVSVILISLWRFFAVPYFSVRNRQQAVLVGKGSAVVEVFTEVNENAKYYIDFSDFIDSGKLVPGELEQRVRKQVDQGSQLIIIDTRDTRIREELANLDDLIMKGVSFVEFSIFYESIFDRIPINHLDHGWLLESLPKGHIGYDAGKWLFDRLGALIGIVFATLLVIPATLALMATGGKPFIYSERLGKGGKTIRIIKLRTMLFFDNGDAQLQKQNKITRVGRLLRKTRIDELPQLINVLRGDLSYIGPRPELPAIAHTYQEAIPFYQARHLIQPGLSGWAQIRDYDVPRGPADIERTYRKLSYDLYYLKHRSFTLDIVIALKTIRALTAFSGS